jgi:SAM-dependent methyltransferase
MNDWLQCCPACGDRDRESVESIRGFDIVRCTTCKLEYTRNPTVNLEDYAKTYGGEIGFLVNPKPYAAPAARLALERDAFFRPPPQLTVAERWVLRRILGHVPKRTPVLDVGCGTGRFLNALRRRSYCGIGVDPVESVVANLRRLGYDVHVGSMPGLGWDGPAPTAITLFEVLEHLPDPIPVLRELRTRFPRASVGASVPSPFRVDLRQGRGQTDYPPNHFLRWTPPALERAFQRAGYRRVEIAIPDPDGSELLTGAGALVPLLLLRHLTASDRVDPHDGPPLVPHSDGPPLRRRVLATAILLGHKTWGAATRVAGMRRARVAARQGWSSASMAVWAEP